MTEILETLTGKSMRDLRARGGRVTTYEVTWTSATGAQQCVSFDDRDDAEHFAAALDRRGFPTRIQEYAPVPAAWNVQRAGT